MKTVTGSHFCLGAIVVVVLQLMVSGGRDCRFDGSLLATKIFEAALRFQVRQYHDLRMCSAKAHRIHGIDCRMFKAIAIAISQLLCLFCRLSDRLDRSLHCPIMPILEYLLPCSLQDRMAHHFPAVENTDRNQ